MTYIKNRKVHFDFELLERLEAGLVLTGQEVKAIRSGKGKLDGAFVQIRENEAFLVGASVNAYQPANTPKNYQPDRSRKLLLTRKQIATIKRKTETERLTVVPIRLYNNKQHIKLEIAIARGKKKVDKRESIKARDTKRDIERTLKIQ